MTRDPLALRSESVAEFTFKAVAAGVVLGVLFGAANAYLGLRVGMTVSASIPAAVMAVVVFRALKLRSTILEVNLAQTIGSASTALATGTIFTIPALFLWGMVPPYMQVVALCFLGGLLGISAMIPLRRLLIVDAHEELPYPEGRACAEVLRASESGTSAGVWIFRGMAVGAAVKILISVAFLFPSEISYLLPVLPKAQLALELSPALFAVGFILGYRQAAVCVAGSIVSSLVLIPLIAWMGAHLGAPLYPETVRLVTDMGVGDIWSRYVRYIGAGAVATAGILTVARNFPDHGRVFRSGRQRPAEEGGDGWRSDSPRRAGSRPRPPTGISRAASSSAASPPSSPSRGSFRASSPAAWTSPSARSAQRASGSSACSSSPSRRASSASSESRRSRPPASLW